MHGSLQNSQELVQLFIFSNICLEVIICLRFESTEIIYWLFVVRKSVYNYPEDVIFEQS